MVVKHRGSNQQINGDEVVIVTYWSPFTIPGRFLVLLNKRP